MDYARKIQPFRSKMQFQELADALNGVPEAQNCNVTVSMPNDSGKQTPGLQSMAKSSMQLS